MITFYECFFVFIQCFSLFLNLIYLCNFLLHSLQLMFEINQIKSINNYVLIRLYYVFYVRIFKCQITEQNNIDLISCQFVVIPKLLKQVLFSSDAQLQSLLRM